MIDFLKELSRRKVWLFGGIYLALGWVLLQVAAVIETTLSLPDWVDQITLVLLGLGLPVALLLAWAKESEPATDNPVEAAPDLSEERPSFSIAVLHFDDLSQDLSLTDISDGIPEDILTRLSSELELKVTARNSSFAFKGTSPNIQDVGKQLVVRFVLEGSVRKIGGKVRVTAQLIDALSGDHLWSEKYDHLIETLDVTLDEAVSGIGSEVCAAIGDFEQERLSTKDLANLPVEDLCSLAEFTLSDVRLSNFSKAEEMLTLALLKEPDNGGCNAMMAHVQSALPIFGSGNVKDHRQRANEYLGKAKMAKSRDMRTLFSMTAAAHHLSRMNDFEIYTEQIRERWPNHAKTWVFTAMFDLRTGQFQKALDGLERGRSLVSVGSGFNLSFLLLEAYAWLGMADFSRAETTARKHLSMRETEEVRRSLVVALAHQGRLEEARKELEEVKKQWGGILTLKSAEKELKRFHVKPPQTAELHLEGLRLAGLA